MAPRSVDHNSGGTRQTLVYFGWLTLFVYWATPSGYLVDIQSSYILKDHLHATAVQVSLFRLVTGIPIYFAFVFGLMRDQWNPLGMRDRGLFLIFAPLSAVAFFYFALSPFTYRSLVLGMLLVMVTFRFVAAAYGGLIALVGQEKAMSGRLSVVWNVIALIPVVLGAFTSGYISEHLRPRATFILPGGLAIMLGLLGLWKPASVFTHAYEKPQARASNFVSDIKRLVRHKAVYPAVLIMFLWSFAPGAATPLQFYLTNVLHASNAVYSYFNGIFAASFIPTFCLYGTLCTRVPLKKLLWWGTLVAVPQMIPLVLIHSSSAALLLAMPIGLLGGMATAAYYDLAMRACPPGLQGTLMMLVDGVLMLAMRSGDLLGSRIYSSSPAHGFLYCVIATTLVYAMILPLILWIPKNLIATADGQPGRSNPAL